MRTLRAAYWALICRRRYRTLLYSELAAGSGRTGYLKGIQAELRSGKYVPHATTLLKVPHPLDVSRTMDVHQLAPRDWIIERALRAALSALYEPTFSSTSCAYRPGYSHTDVYRLASVAQSEGLVWFACADVARFFLSIDRDLLLRELEAFTSDSSATAIVRACISSSNVAGLPLGHVLSPFLSNVFLHPIDVATVIQPAIRYSDDWFLPRRTRHEAEHALRTLEEVLASRGLQLHARKQRVIFRPDPVTLLNWAGVTVR